ncbi:membrane protein insertase YidC [Flavobacterium lindanitolerans]|uniref:Membrane protein insertase YidC n=1 Tax=Flavobacterium lindanitolerans TaxID=428988 RepID=A0A497U9C4_9FLAO|nr:membrane protein insertase YidC [Flavobacterium lindanitolerans]PKW29976.1 protein translocase subunit yidC [Flavobacterium lindanitolerans]RLJ24316.1 YidC/Oxa1 family membrane protein insertase [Flavobacterium lindanitolerans]
MEEKKFDRNSIIGFLLIFMLLLGVMYINKPSQKEIDAKAKIEAEKQKAAAKTSEKEAALTAVDTTAKDSLQLEKLKSSLGSFAYAATLPSAKQEIQTLENDLVKLTFSNKGGYIVGAEMKNFEAVSKGSGELVKIIKDNNAKLNIELKTQGNLVLNTKDLYFEPALTKEGENQVLTMRLKAGPEQYLEYRYVLKPKEYMLDFSIRTQGLSKVLLTSNPLPLEWTMKTYRSEKSISYENRYTELVYEYENGKDDYLGQSSSNTEAKDVTYIAFKQHFFTSILLTDTPFKVAELKSDNLVKDIEKDTIFTKSFKATVPLAFKGGEVNYNMNWYYGPADYKILNKYDKNLDEVISLGWGIFGWINRWIFIPVYDFLSLFLSHGIAIIVFTILVRLVMSPVTYKSYLSQAKMKVLRPEIMELNEKFKKDPMKKQQETMKLYNKAGVNPMAGCLPALMQIPVFYALFQFFPSAIELRQKSFLWAEDLSSFDAIFSWKQHIPVISGFYGNHISLFPILAAIAIFFYMKMTTGDQTMSAPPQEGMPDMSKIMKMMIYLSPLMMMIFFNNNASGLSLYYFVSNTITIGIMLVIKNYIINDEKIHARIQENKTKEKPKSKFQQKMQEMMEQAQEQQKQKNKALEDKKKSLDERKKK